MHIQGPLPKIVWFSNSRKEPQDISLLKSVISEDNGYTLENTRVISKSSKDTYWVIIDAQEVNRGKSKETKEVWFNFVTYLHTLLNIASEVVKFEMFLSAKSPIHTVNTPVHSHPILLDSLFPVFQRLADMSLPQRLPQTSWSTLEEPSFTQPLPCGTSISVVIFVKTHTHNTLAQIYMYACIHVFIVCMTLLI